MSEYSQLLLDPRWQKRRLEMLKEADWACQCCLDTTKTLHVHHIRYIKGRKPWEYSDSELRVLCKDCHADEHKVQKIFAQLSIDSPEPMAIISLCLGFLQGEIEESNELEDMCEGAICGEHRLVGILSSMLLIAGSNCWEKVAEALEDSLTNQPLSTVQDLAMRSLLGRDRKVGEWC